MEQKFQFKCNYGTYNQFRYICDTLDKSNSEVFEDAIIFASMADDRNMRWAYAAEEIVGGPNYERRVCDELGIKTIKVYVDDACMDLIAEGCRTLRTSRPLLIDAAISMYADYIHEHGIQKRADRRSKPKRNYVKHNEELTYKSDVRLDWSHEEDLDRIMKTEHVNQNEAVLRAIAYLKRGILNGSEHLPSHIAIFNSSRTDSIKRIWFRYGESTAAQLRWIRAYYDDEHTIRDVVYEAIRRYSDVLYASI